MTTLQEVELGVLGTLQVRRDGVPVAIPGAKPRAILTMLGLHGGSVVSADTLAELLWGADPPRTAAKALQTHISALRRALGDGFVSTEGAGWTVNTSEIDATRYQVAAGLGRDAAGAGDSVQAVAQFDQALKLWRGIPELPDGSRGVAERTRWIESHAALVEDRADALLATGRAAEIIGELEAGIAEQPLREKRWGQLMLALYRAGRQGEALAAYQRARTLLTDELGVDPGPDLRRLEAAIVTQDDALELAVSQRLSPVTRAVTFLLTDIEGSTAAWEANAAAMGVALARHDEIVEQVVTFRGGRLVKTRGEGDATFSVFDRPSAAAAAAIELQEAIRHEPWAPAGPIRIRVALHTGEVELRDGDYFGRAVNRAARLRSLAAGDQILCSGATAELVIDALPDDVLLADLGMRQLKNLARPEHVFELRLDTAVDESPPPADDAPMERPELPSVLAGPGPFVGRGVELAQLLTAWQSALTAGARAALIAGEPGVGKTRLAGEWSRQAYEQGAVVLYGRCDEDLGAPYQPFAEALRSLVPCIGTNRLRSLRGVEALLPLVPGLTEVVPDLAAPTRADPDTERYALFDAVVALLEVASGSAPVVLILDDLHWAAKPTLLLLRHLLRFGERARVQILGTYRSTDLDRSHPLAAMLADLNRDGTASRIALSGLGEEDVSAFVAEAGYADEDLARALASVTGGNPFFLIEALRHVEESGGRWDPSTLPQGVREAVSRRLSRLPEETNKALAAAAVVGSRFAVDLVEQVVEQDLVDAFDEACKAGIVIEERGGFYRFNHAIVRQSLLAELASVRRMRLHQRIATALETQPGADDELLAELAYHYFECAWAGNAAKAVEYCRRAADQAMARLGYEGAADLYDRALHALEEIDDELPDRDEQRAELLVARCEALLAAGDAVSASGAVAQLQQATPASERLAAWATCFDGQLSMLIHPERLDEVEVALSAAARTLAALDDAAGEAKAHTVRAGCLARLGRVGDCESALDEALTAARRAQEHRRVNAVLAGAPLAALWGPNPVPRAGGRCLDVVRLLRITTDSPAVEAISTRCQAVLEAYRGRDAAARRMIDTARRTVTELGLRHALLEVEHFAGIVELVLDDPAAAEPHLRKAYNGFRRMGLDADTAEAAALLGRVCLLLDREPEADELCSESERLAGHALKASIAWRTVRAQLLARRGDHDEARRVAEAAVAVAERTDGLVDHGDACLALATVLDAAGDTAGTRAAAQRAVDLYERKGAAALAEKARQVLGGRVVPTVPAASEVPAVELDNACVRVGERLGAAIDRQAWDEVEQLFAAGVVVKSHRKMLHWTLPDLQSGQWPQEIRRFVEIGPVRPRVEVIAVRGERLALTRLEVRTPDTAPGAPYDEMLQLSGLDEDGRIAVQVYFDVDDLDTAIAELDALQARLARESPRRLENAASRAFKRLAAYFVARDWGALTELVAENVAGEDRRPVIGMGNHHGRDALIRQLQVAPDLGVTRMTSDAIANRGDHLILTHAGFSRSDETPEPFRVDLLYVVEINADERIAAIIAFDPDDLRSALAELDARYLAGEAAPHAQSWSVIAANYAAINRHEAAATTPDWVNVDHRRVKVIPAGEMTAVLHASWSDTSDDVTYVESVHRLGDRGAVVTQVTNATSSVGFEAEWRMITVSTVDGELCDRCEVFDEADLDAALARFDELSRPARQLDNTAYQSTERFMERFAARDWDAMAQLVRDDVTFDDRRRVVNADLQVGRDRFIENFRIAADLGAAQTVSAIATRGDRLVLVRARFALSDGAPEGFGLDLLHVVEIDADNRTAGTVTFDPDDLDAAFTELDARYLAGEAAAHAQVWSVITQAYEGFNRKQTAPMTPDCATIDNRRAVAFEPGDMTSYLRAAWEDSPDTSIYIEAVHRLSDLGAVVTHVARGTSQDGFEAEWRDIDVLTVDGDRFNRSELYDEADLDAALARFDELSHPARLLENTATRVNERAETYFAARDWNAVATVLAPDICSDDRRRVVGGGLLRGRDAVMAATVASAEAELKIQRSDPIATRGERLVLSRARWSGADERPGAFHSAGLLVTEIDATEQILAHIMFDADDLDAAFADLDARYLAGEAAAHAQVWSVIARTIAAANRHELPSTTPDWVSIDHRPGIALEPGDLKAYLRSAWDDMPVSYTYVEAVHRLSDLGVVVTHAAEGTTPKDFQAEWRGVDIMTVEGELISRSEMFDETDLDAALERFEELGRPAPRLENAASRVVKRGQASFEARDWDTFAAMLAENISNEDRRRVVGSGVRLGRDAQMTDMQAVADLFPNVTSTVLATRGERLVLARTTFSDRVHAPEALITEALSLFEIDTDERVAVLVTFDPDDVDAAFEELDARYLVGEAALYARVWRFALDGLDELNRHEPGPIIGRLAYVDHRRLSFGSEDFGRAVEQLWALVPDARYRVTAVHALAAHGTVVSVVIEGTDAYGSELEWPRIILLIPDEPRIGVYDESDLDAALAKFGELSRPAPRLENAATRMHQRHNAYFIARDWDAMADMVADDICTDDRRRVVNGGIQRGRGAHVANMRAIADVGVRNIDWSAIAIRGNRLALVWTRPSGGQSPEAFSIETVVVIEVDADGRSAAAILFDPEDRDAAFAELDARYAAGEAAPYAQTWSVISKASEAFNRHEQLPVKPDWVNLDHRRGISFEPGDLMTAIRDGWEDSPDLSIYIEVVHRLSKFGAVVTRVACGTTRDDFAAEWRGVDLYTVDGALINQFETYEESDLDAALARFEELQPRVPRLENTASRAHERFLAHFRDRDWAAIAEILTEDSVIDDRHDVVTTAGFWDGRDAVIANLQALAEAAPTTWAVIATRGERLVLTRICSPNRDERNGNFSVEMLVIAEVDTDGRIAVQIAFDPDDMDAAFAELDARYLAGEAAEHAHTWQVIAGIYAAMNRHELPTMAPDWVTVDHRRLPTFSGDLTAYLGATWELTPDIAAYIETVHRLGDFGAVITLFSQGTSQGGFAAEWRMIAVSTVEGDLLSRGEIFDEADLDAAIARFEELGQPASGLETPATPSD